MKHFYGTTRGQIEKEIDAFLALGNAFKPLDIALPSFGSRKFEYRGLQVREWHYNGNVRFDTMVELLGNEKWSFLRRVTARHLAVKNTVISSATFLAAALFLRRKRS